MNECWDELPKGQPGWASPRFDLSAIADSGFRGPGDGGTPDLNPFAVPGRFALRAD